MKRYSLLPFAFLLLLIASCNVNERPLKIITFNIRYDNPRDSINAWPNRLGMVCDFLKAENPDLFGLQEALWHQYEAVDSALNGYSSVAAGRDDGKKKGEMTPVFFRTGRFELLTDSTFWLSPDPGIPGSKGWGASLPRIVTWVKLKDKKSGQFLFYFNTHFAHDSDSARIMSAKILLAEVKRIAQGQKFVITGDFNMVPESIAYSVLTEQGNENPIISDSFTVSENPPSGPAGTFNGWKDKTGAGRIDYIFLRKGMTAESVATVIKKEGNIFISDHWPVVSVVKFK